MTATFPYPARTMAQVDADTKPRTRRPRLDCRRAVPADFATVAPTKTKRELIRHYRTGPDTLRRWLAETRIAPKPTGKMRAPPRDFATLAPAHSVRALAKHYRTTPKVIDRWTGESGVSPAKGLRSHRKAVPADLAVQAKALLFTELATHYAVGTKLIRRWLNETGIEPLVYVAPRRTVPVKVVRPSFRPVNPGAPFQSLRRDASLEGQAADHLRHWQPVYRCTERGGVPDDARPGDKRLTHWRIGNGVATGAELIERAARKGFDPEQWRRIAA